MKKDLVIAFVIGIFTHKAQNAIGNWVVDLITSVIKNDLEHWPIIRHYALKHSGRSVGCAECLLAKNVDGIRGS